VRIPTRSVTDVVALPDVGTRVSMRYRRAAGAVPPLTDVVGRLVQTEPSVLVQTKTGAIQEIALADVVAVRTLTQAPLRTSQIRALEHAAALAWPGIEQEWIGGWLLRGADGHTHRANSAVPLGVDADARALPAIVDWYAQRGLTPWLAVADRLLAVPSTISVHMETVVMVRGLPAGDADAATTIAPIPDANWLQLYQRQVPVDVLTAAVDGVVAFATSADAAVGRVAVTTAPNGTRWAGISAVRVADDQRREGHARRLCTALMDWATAQRATHCYVQVLADNAGAIALYEQLGFAVQHRARYIDGRSL
jgi:N-acetylglutamate synthase